MEMCLRLTWEFLMHTSQSALRPTEKGWVKRNWRPSAVRSNSPGASVRELAGCGSVLIVHRYEFAN